jgi:hypothetical protein
MSGLPKLTIRRNNNENEQNISNAVEYVPLNNPKRRANAIQEWNTAYKHVPSAPPSTPIVPQAAKSAGLNLARIDPITVA